MSDRKRQVSKQFDWLHGELENLDKAYPESIWDSVVSSHKEARDCIGEARRLIKPLLRESEDYPPWIRDAAQKIACSFSSFTQYGSTGDYAAATRIALHIDHRVPPYVVAVLMSITAAFWAARLFSEIPQEIKNEAIDQGLNPGDEKDVEKIRSTLRSWELQETKCGGKFLKEAEKHLTEAARLRQEEKKTDQARREKEEAVSRAGIEAIRQRNSEAGSKEKGSKGIRELAKRLRNEYPNSSKQWLFDHAMSEINGKGCIVIEGYSITLIDKTKLYSTLNGQRDGRPVDFDGWAKFCTARRK